MTLLSYLLVVGWSVWLGSVVFFSFVVAPTAFHALGREGAAPLMRRIFPRYYLAGLLAGGTMLLCALALGAGLRITVPIVIGLALVAYARQVITPAVNQARDARDDDRFARLHALSVRLNIVVLAILLVLGAVIAGLTRT